jgi:hypothetical protein
VEDNIIDLDIPNPIRQFKSKNVRYFNNRTSAGALIQGAEEDVYRQVFATLSELTVEVEDATLLAI